MRGASSRRSFSHRYGQLTKHWPWRTESIQRSTLSALHNGVEAARISPECGDNSESDTIYACKATERWITP